MAPAATAPRPAPADPAGPDGTAMLRHDWRADEAVALIALPFNDLVFRAQQVHRRHFDPNAVQISTLLSVKTGACPEDCKYCPQSAHYDTGLEPGGLLAVGNVLAAAATAWLSISTATASVCAARARLAATVVTTASVLAMVRVSMASASAKPRSTLSRHGSDVS